MRLGNYWLVRKSMFAQFGFIHKVLQQQMKLCPKSHQYLLWLQISDGSGHTAMGSPTFPLPATSQEVVELLFNTRATDRPVVENGDLDRHRYQHHGSPDRQFVSQ